MILEFLIFMKLFVFNFLKVYGLDGILVWLLKENVDFLVGLVFVIFNFLFYEFCFLFFWKEVDVVLVLK